MSWRVARSLLRLRDQINAKYPHRNKASDGFIGDEDHSKRNSDHNPWYGPGIVTAGDYTHDPITGIDIDDFTDELVASRDYRIKYIIANGYILSGAGGPKPWLWRSYSGANPHTKHFHLSVVADKAADDDSDWNIPSLRGGIVLPQNKPATSGFAVLRKGPPWIDGVSTGHKVLALQGVLDLWYPWLNISKDGYFGKQTEDAVLELQRRARYDDPSILVDGLAGKQVFRLLHMS